MGIQLPGFLQEARAFVGVEFPSTNESALRGRADDWRELADLTSQVIARIERGVDEVATANVGSARDGFVEFMSGGGGNVGSLNDFRAACEQAAAAHHIAAMVIMGLKTFTIAQLGLVAAAMATARAAGPAALPYLHGVQHGARTAIQGATAAAAAQLRAG